MATQLPPPARLEPAIESLLSRLRRRIRAYIWADGLAALLVLLGVAFWMSLTLDWLIEPPRPLRVVVLVAMAGALAWVAYRALISRLLVPLNDRSLAVVLERKFRQFRDSLLTAVELNNAPEHATDFNHEMLAHSRREALLGVRQVKLAEVFNTAPLMRRVSLGVALALAIGVLAVAAPQAVGTWARRSLLLSNELWPRRTHLSVAGFDKSKRVKIARGSDWELLVQADAATGREVPEIVEVRYSTTEGVRGRENMSREGIVAAGQGQRQPYRYDFKSVLAPLEFYVAGGDDRQGPYQLDVVDSPTISAMTLRCEFPEYTGRPARDLPVAGLMQVPQGTLVTIVASSNKQLVDVQIDDVADETTPITKHIDVIEAANGGSQDRFEFKLGRLDSDKTLLFTLRDVDGIRSREAVRLTLSAVPDEPPQVNVMLKGIGAAITPQARLPAMGEVTDDYGVTRVWFDFHVDDAEPDQRALETHADGSTPVEVVGVMEVADLKLQPKQRLHWAVQAADNSALAKGENVGTSQRYALDVVTGDQLRSLLEARELALRRRFESMIDEFTDTRDLLGGLQFAVKEEPAAGEQAEGDKTADENGAGDKAASPAVVLSPAVQVERVVQNSERSVFEVAELSVSFEEICDELVNNRIDTVELKMRLQDGISRPLSAIAAERFPPLLEKLERLSGELSAPQAAVSTQAAALAEADAILVEMRSVLDKMLELETFNEALDLLREIIASQEAVNEETKQQQKKDLRSLIE